MTGFAILIHIQNVKVKNLNQVVNLIKLFWNGKTCEIKFNKCDSYAHMYPDKRLSGDEFNNTCYRRFDKRKIIDSACGKTCKTYAI